MTSEPPQSEPRPYRPPVQRWMVLLLAVLLVIQIRADRPRDAYAGPWEGANGLRRLARVYGEIRNRYGDSPADQELFVAAIQGMLSRLDDPYSDYLPPLVQEDLEGLLYEQSIGGIGILPRFEPERGVVISQLIPGGPSDRAGLLPGDTIVRIDGTSVGLLTEPQVYERLRGTVGTEVTVDVLREDNRLQTFRLIRGELPHSIPVSARMLDETKRIGLLRVFKFSEGTATAVREALQPLQKQGLRGLIVDLRWNGGGSLEEGLLLSELFLQRGQIITILEYNTDRDSSVVRPRRTAQRAGGRAFVNVPVVVLVNGETASSSEIFAGALQDNGRAVLVGTTTTGKGRFQEVLPLGQQAGALRLTVGRYLTPKERDIQDQGLSPDVEIPLEKQLEERLFVAWTREMFDNRLPLPPEMATDQPDDPQLDKALQHLRIQMGEPTP